MQPRRLVSIAGTIAQWLLWIVCVLLILPVLMSVPGNPDFGDFALYMAVLGSVTTYPVLLPVLAVLEHRARRRNPPAGVGAIRTMAWLAFCGVVAVFAAAGAAAYAREKARPVPTKSESFSNAYANAILHRDTGWMDRLMAEGADVDHAISEGRTAAIMSASFGQWSLVVFLLGRGADPDRVDDAGNSVRTLAAEPKSPATAPEDIQALAQVRELLRRR